MSKDVKRIVTCTTPYGVVSRTTARTYTHAVVLSLNDNTLSALAWCGSHQLAQKQLNYWAKNLKYRYSLTDPRMENYDLTIYPVDKADSPTDEWRHVFAKDSGHEAIPADFGDFCTRCLRPIVKVLGGTR